MRCKLPIRLGKKDNRRCKKRFTVSKIPDL